MNGHPLSTNASLYRNINLVNKYLMLYTIKHKND
jgi:hypothetical protein